MRDMTVGLDRSFSEVDMIQRYNSDLANDLGNAVNRVTKMIGRYADGVAPAPGITGADEERKLEELALHTAAALPALVDSLAMNQVIEEILGLVRSVNRYLEIRAPWNLAREEGQADLLGTTLYTAAEALRIAGILIGPVMPARTEDLLRQLGVTTGDDCDYDSLTGWGGLEPGTPVPGGEGIFPRLELPEDLQG
jgi:methionyl-tRNA synthetase